MMMMMNGASTSGGGPVSLGAEVVARHSFNGHSADDLAFNKNDVLKVVSTTNDPNWFRARRNDGTEGMVPVNYVTEQKADLAHTRMPWFHGLITRDQTEKLLGKRPNGTFLVRESTNFPGDYTLCVSHNDKVEHYRIQRKANRKLTCDDEEFFDNLPQMIAHYEIDADGLCHKLTFPLRVDGFDELKAEDMSDGVQVSPTVTSLKTLAAIPRNDIDLGDIVGHGEFGDVHVGWMNNKKVAVKVLKKSNNKMVESLLQEASFMKSLTHPNLVQLLGVVWDTEVYMVTEFLANGNLVDYLRSRGRHQVTKEQQINFACDVCHGMEFLETRNLVHRDLAARNILLDEKMTAKVSDFGLAKRADISSAADDAKAKFPIKWTAPEALRFSKFTTKSDVWSFGVLLWEIYSYGRVPYPRIPIQDVVKHIEKGYRMEPPENCPTEICKIMSNTWAFKPEDRPSFHSLLTQLVTVQQKSSQHD